jgi:hypothetical protein
MDVMSTRLVKREVYTANQLTGLAKRCDWFICGSCFVNITNTDFPDFIFLSAYRGCDSIKHFVTYLPKLTNPFKVIIASEDCTFPNSIGDLRGKMYEECQLEIQQMLSSPLLIHCFVENLDDPHSTRMSPIPLGLLNSTYKVNIRADPIDLDSKPLLCLCVHRNRVGPQWTDRKTAMELSKDKWSDFVEYVDADLTSAAHFQKISQAKFCLCIHGGGYDPCPRFFECILAGTIPIIQHSPLDAVFQRFPVVYIGDLSENSLSESFLLERLEALTPFYEDQEKRAEVLRMLTMDYWWNFINRIFV